MAVTNEDYKASELYPKTVTVTNTTSNEYDLQMYQVNLHKIIGGRNEENPDGQSIEFTIESSEEFVYYDSLYKNLGDEWNLDNDHKITFEYSDAGGSSSSGNVNFNWDKFFEHTQDTIVDNSFQYEQSILYVSSVTIPDTATAIGASAFSNWDSLSEVKLPNTITSIGDNAFAECPSLVSITIPGSVESLGDYVFACDGGNKAALESVTFETPSSLTSIGVQAFEGQWHLPSITIPSSVETIGENCFTGMDALETITINKPEGSIEGAPWGASETTQIIWNG